VDGIIFKLSDRGSKERLAKSIITSTGLVKMACVETGSTESHEDSKASVWEDIGTIADCEDDSGLANESKNKEIKIHDLCFRCMIYPHQLSF
jgi:hypothetical protein